MSGQVLLYDNKVERVLDERRDHRKYVVKVIVSNQQAQTWVATAGWDAQVFIYLLQRKDPDGKPVLGSPVAFLTLPTNPDTIALMDRSDSQSPVLLVARRDSTSLYYYNIPEITQLRDSTSIPQGLSLLGTQNLAPHSNTWVSSSPCAVAVCPTDPTLLAVAMSTLPHLKLLVVRMLIPPHSTTLAESTGSSRQVGQAREELSTQSREEAAIHLSINTLAPQTPYSTAQVCWRPDGSGIWINGDDGVMRGIDAITGEVAVTLKNGHEAGSKIRSMWAGMVRFEGQDEEWVLSGGFDKKLIVWRP